MYIRNDKYKEQLQTLCKAEFDWERREENLYLLKEGDFKNIAKQISCNQDIASDSSFSLGMLAPFSSEIINLNATGIGCYLDDIFHKLLGLKSNQFQSLYHFTIGRALIDSRILDVEIYKD